MAINVTPIKVNPQEEKPFPKLMIGNKDWVVEVHEHPQKKGKYIAIHRCGPYAGEIAMGFSLDDSFSDYNEPITIQNA